MKIIIIQIIAFLSLGTTVLAQNKKLDSLYNDFEGSITSSSHNIFDKYDNGCIFSMKLVISANGSIKSLTISNNIDNTLTKDYLIKNIKTLKLAYFKEIARIDKQKWDATYIVPVILLNNNNKPKIEFDNPSLLVNLFKYNDILQSSKNITILRPCVIQVAIRH